MSANHTHVAKPKVQARRVPGQGSPAKALTEAWRERVKHIRLNKPGQKRLTLHQLIAEGRG